MRDRAAHILAEKLERGGYPGDEEMSFYTEEFGCAMLVVPGDKHAGPVIHGHGPVGFELKQMFGRGPEGAAGVWLKLASRRTRRFRGSGFKAKFRP